RARRTEPYVSRARTLGKAMYSLIGVPRGDQTANWAQWGRNYKFFDAPVGLIFTIDRRLATGSWLDYGMFLQNVMTAARGRGLDTCAQAAWTHFHRAIRSVLTLAEAETVVCGMALGHADPDAPENSLMTTRAPATSFMRFDGFT
ncbi:MAG TPA: nitroreductase, partial [Rhodopila sp.]|nr:nitroreductase [Rhodopila sp.]